MKKISENIKISIFMCSAIILGFSIVFALILILEPKLDISSKEKEFFLRVETFDENTIIILGSSQTASFNATYLENNLLNNNKDYSIYNLSISADRPQKRLSNIDKIIELQPKMVIYGIGYIDFENLEKMKIDKPRSFMPDAQEIFVKLISLEQYFDFDFLIFSSPKYIILKSIRDQVNSKQINEYYDEKTPFFSYDLNKKRIILDDKNLKKNSKEHQLSGIKPQTQNQDVIAFKKILQKFKENNIDVIIINMPFHPYYKQIMPKYYNDFLNKITQNSLEEFDVKTYSLIDEYDKLKIWNDSIHISINEKGISTLNDDLLNILLEHVN